MEREPAQLRFDPPVRVVVLASGSGTLLQALLDACRRPDYPAQVVAVGADRPGVEALRRAERAGISHFVVGLGDYADRRQWDAALTKAVAAHEPDLVVSAGFLKILGPEFLRRFPSRVINTHPALLPAFPGTRAVADALAAGVQVTGSTVHLVDDGVDTGPIVAQEAVAVEPDDDESSLHERVKTVERRLLVDVVERLARGGCAVTGRKVTLL
jgi:formyltetrahydrofolate-dependent phosphoribosylglycinamide formyltransferase